MFCPKCGLQNSDTTKFCRSCGVNLSSVLAIVEGELPDKSAESEKYGDLYSSGIRNLILGFGFTFIGILLLFNLPSNTFFWLLMLFSAFLLLASGISRIVKAEMKPKKKAGVIQPNLFPSTRSNPALPPIQTEYIKSSKSTSGIDDLAGQPLSVTEPTTRRLQMDSEGEDDFAAGATLR